MTETLTRAHARTTKQDWRGHALALVLFAVLVWYTVVSPSYTAAPLAAPAAPEPEDAEEREAETRAARGFAVSFVPRADGPRSGESAIGVGGDDDQLDWPEIIGGD